MTRLKLTAEVLASSGAILESGAVTLGSAPFRAVQLCTTQPLHALTGFEHLEMVKQ